MTVLMAANATLAKLVSGVDDRARDIVGELLSYMVEGVEHMGTGGWDGRSSFFSRRTNSFPAGFLHIVHAKLVASGYKVQIAKKPLPKPLGVESPVVDEHGNDDPRYEFQLRALRQVEKHGRGIIQVATGGGKSKIAKLIAARYRRMTLFLTTRGILMYQMKEGFEDAQLPCGIIGDSIFAPVRGVNCGMVQTFVAKLKETTLDKEIRGYIGERTAFIQRMIKKGMKLPDVSRAEAVKVGKERFEQKTKERDRFIKLLELVEVVIGEEAHEAGGDSYYEILRHCKNAQIRVALTATPFMRDDAEDNMRLMAAFGPILIKVSEKTLIDRGILAKPYFLFFEPKPHPKLRRTSPWQRAVDLEIVSGPDRNARIVSFARKAVDHGLAVMVLVTRTKHGDVLQEMFAAAGIKAAFIRGEDDQKGRKRELNNLKGGRIECLTGTTILDVGVDVPAVGMMILAGGGKAEVSLRQRIGRALRAKKLGPNVAFVVDFADTTNQFLRDHARTRRAIIEQTPGFAEGILPAGADFPWHLFKSVSKAA